MLIGASGVDGDSANSTLPRPRVWLAASVVPPCGVVKLSAPLIVWPLGLTLSVMSGPNNECPAKMYAPLTVLSVTLSKVTLLLAAVISNEKPAIVVGEAPVLVRVTSRLLVDDPGVKEFVVIPMIIWRGRGSRPREPGHAGQGQGRPMWRRGEGWLSWPSGASVVPFSIDGDVNSR